MAHDREVAGIRCFKVLEVLSEYLDGELAAEASAQLEAHLRGCDWCEKMGSEIGAMVREVRSTLVTEGDVSPEVGDRLMERLSKTGANEV